MTKLLLFLVRLYQNSLSPDHGWFKHWHPYGYCRFSPSCSNYALSVIEQRGLGLGLIRTIWRLIRCNPWNKGGFDPVK